MHPLDGFRFKLKDFKGEEVRHGIKKEGILSVAGSSVMSGYLDFDPTPRTKQELDQKKKIKNQAKDILHGEWMETGDLVRWDESSSPPILTFIARVLSGQG